MPLTQRESRRLWRLVVDWVVHSASAAVAAHDAEYAEDPKMSADAKRESRKEDKRRERVAQYLSELRK